MGLERKGFMRIEPRKILLRLIIASVLILPFLFFSQAFALIIVLLTILVMAALGLPRFIELCKTWIADHRGTQGMP